MICPDVDIVTPDGDPEKAGEGGDNADNEAVFDDKVFDDPPQEGEPEGQCWMLCRTKSLPNLSPASRLAVWEQIEWSIGKAGDVDPAFAGVVDKPDETLVMYGAMPAKPDQFGPRTLALTFNDRPKWGYYQKVELFFHTTGKSASAHGGANVKNGDPNWYVYWQQLAGAFSGQAGGTFGPQCAMEWNSNDHPQGDPQTVGKYAYEAPPQEQGQGALLEKIILYNALKDNMVECIRTIHHENGHRQSRQLPNNQGGWGAALLYVWNSDADGDFVHDGFEAAIQGDPFTPGVDDSAALENWDHDVYDPATGKGLCRRNEAEVNAKANDLKEGDWSSTGEKKGHR